MSARFKILTKFSDFPYRDWEVLVDPLASPIGPLLVTEDEVKTFCARVIGKSLIDPENTYKGNPIYITVVEPSVWMYTTYEEVNGI